MQYNIFKVKDKKKLLEEMIERGYIKKGEEIKSGEYTLNLNCKYEDDQKINWREVFEIFNERNVPKKTGLSSIIICDNGKNVYAITYGTSSFLVEKNSDKEFGFDIAKRMELKEMKRKSSIAPHSNKNSSITSYRNTKTVLFETGENITSLSFSPTDDSYGKRIDIGKSIKFNLDINLNEICNLFEKIDNILKLPVLNKIPLLVKIKNQEEINNYFEIMYKDLNKEYEKYSKEDINQEYVTPFNVNEFSIVGTSFYFENENKEIIKIGKNEYEMEINDIDDLFNLSKAANIEIQALVETGKIIHKDSSNETIYSETLKKHINYEIPNEKVSLYEGDWYGYNDDYLNLVFQEINTIDIRYEKTDNFTKTILDKTKTKDYREQKINKILTERYNGKLLDRDLFVVHYENEYFNGNYRIEIADLVLNDIYFSIKVGEASSLAYCVDQSELSARLINAKKIDLAKLGLLEPNKYGLWFYLEKINIFKNEPISITNIGSIMLLSKISRWSKEIKSMGKIPIIYINKYEK